MKIFEEGCFNRNKKIILIAVMIMLISAIAGAGIAYMNADGKYNIISSAMSSNATGNGYSDDIGVGAAEIFIHNVITDLIIILGGFFFSIISVILVIINGVSIGGLFGIDLPYASVTVLPHGIIEYFASSLALVIAFKITQLEINVIKNGNVRNTLGEHKIDIKDIFAIFVVMMILLAIAGFIEGIVTPRIAAWYFGL